MPLTDFKIKSLMFSGGQQIAVEPASLLLLVGPNNAGKSATLREVGTWLAPSHLRITPVVLHGLEFENPDEGELFGAMRSVYPNTELPDGTVTFAVDNGVRATFPGTKQEIRSLYQVFYRALIQRLDTETRLTYANPAPRRDLFGQDVPDAGIHWLQKDDAIYRKVNAVVRDAFGGDLLIDWGGGTSVGFHFGDAPLLTSDCDRVSSA